MTINSDKDIQLEEIQQTLTEHKVTVTELIKN